MVSPIPFGSREAADVVQRASLTLFRRGLEQKDERKTLEACIIELPLTPVDWMLVGYRGFLNTFIRLRWMCEMTRNDLGTVLIGACSGGHLDFVKKLVYIHGANVSFNNNSPIVYALVSGKWKIVKFLRSVGASLPIRNTFEHRSLVVRAILQG